MSPSGSSSRRGELEKLLRPFRQVLKDDRSMPLHWQVEQVLNRAILLLDGGVEEPFFTELEIGELLSVSAPTVNRAVRALSARGAMLEKNAASGVFSRPEPCVDASGPDGGA